jgi:preprotein translocase subunit SecG
MRKFALAAAAFVIAATLGIGLLALGSIVIVILAHHNSSGIGAVAGGLSRGISGATVLIVPVLCGVVGAYLAMRRVGSRL